MSHDSSFPDSTEAPDQRTERALAALQYEERAGLGFRRRDRKAIGNPYEEPERYQVNREPTAGDLWAGLLAGVGVVLGFAAIFYKPLLLATVATIFTVLGSLGEGESSRVAKAGFYVVMIGFVVGMLVQIFLTKKPIW